MIIFPRPDISRDFFAIHVIYITLTLTQSFLYCFVLLIAIKIDEFSLVSANNSMLIVLRMEMP